METLQSLASVLGLVAGIPRAPVLRAPSWSLPPLRPVVASVLRRVGLLTAGALLAVGLLEAAARCLVETPWGKSDEELAEIVPVAWSRNTFQPDPVLGYRPSANFDGRMIRRDQYDVAFHTNSMALRDREFPVTPAARRGASRILMLGDSFVFGMGVAQDEPFAKVLERRLNAGSHTRYEVVNAGVNGYGIDQYEAWLSELLPHYQPDVVLVALFVGNDFRPYADPSQQPVARGVTELDGYHVIGHGPVESWLIRNTHLGYFLERRLPKLEWLFDRLRGYVPHEDVAAIFASARPYLDGIRALAEDHGARVGFVLIPDKRQLQWPELDPGPRTPWILALRDAARAGLDERTARVRRYLAATHAPTLDLTPRFREYGAESLYFAHDGHLNAYGHEIAGRLLEPWVARRFGDELHAGSRSGPALGGS